MTSRSLAKYSGTIGMFSTWMYCQTSSSVQFDSGNTRMLSPLLMRLFSSFQSSGRWFFGSHWPLRVAQREDALLGPRAFLVAAGAAEGRVEVAGLERVEQRLRLEQPAAPLRADQKRLRAVGDRFLVGVDDQRGADFRRCTGRGTRSSRGTCTSCPRAGAGRESGPGWNAFCASRSSTDESLPIE